MSTENYVVPNLPSVRARSRRATSTSDVEEIELGSVAQAHSADSESVDASEADALIERDSVDKPQPTSFIHCVSAWKSRLFGKQPPRSRTIHLTPNSDERAFGKFPANRVRNQKYNPFTFLPVVLFEQFKYFFNLYFLIVALSQFVPALQIGFFFTYMAPLAFVVMVSVSKEAWDDFKRYRRDKEANQERYDVLTTHGVVCKPSSDICVGDLVFVRSNQRVPADMVLLRTTEKSGASFIRTDQMDGETDWKLRHAVGSCQKFGSDQELVQIDAMLYAEAPRKEIYEFIGTFTRNDVAGHEVEALTLENTLWSSTVIASGTIVGLVVYTGSETRSVMNASAPATKFGKIDLEINRLSKVLVVMTLGLALLLVGLKGFHGSWFVTLFRFMLLLSSIIPISLRVNLDMGKTVESVFVMRDQSIPGTVVRTSTIPEELGRIEYLFTDKTGTLTRNEMEFMKLHVGAVLFTSSQLTELRTAVHGAALCRLGDSGGSVSVIAEENALVYDAVKAIALCHNVTPALEDGVHIYQAASPDEVALVKFAESVGMTLIARDLHTITLKAPGGASDDFVIFDVLNIFPFTSASKRMGIVVRDRFTQEITFYMKGADAVMSDMVQYNEWLEEECGNMAREGLRTLVFAKRRLSEDEYVSFAGRYAAARASIAHRDVNVAAVVASLERDLILIGVTGVEDRLQQDVKESLEILRSAGIKTWMLTGDKVETATCIAVSARLVGKDQQIFHFAASSRAEAVHQLNVFGTKRNTCLVIDGHSLQICLDHMAKDFAQTACRAPTVVCCRCSPTQKADIVRLIHHHTQKETCGVGDGGNDVGMILAANVGIGLVGKEGKQAALAADFSIEQFSYLTRLLLWHGRNSYKRSARLSQFVIHRGMIISVIQAVFSALFYFSTTAIYTGWLMVGYTTVYTMAPVFSLILDEDVNENLVFRYPELYRELQLGRALSMKTFCFWMFKSVYQGGTIMLLAMVMFEDAFINIVSITFTALILAELFNVGFEVHKWHWVIVVSELTALLLYVSSLFVLRSYFDITFVLTWTFVWKVLVITAVSCLPIYLAELLQRRLAPPSYTKVMEE
eukprot:TRINITY_DN2476_c0_g1_i3.p1 TRINITY_DN2476_c0_g1~~TRINITY_DN2476_c0_g1_i3.p1  ORF type:complete len:1081 (+),score=133.21 TRINITY_DN2476_c0_g1_i3:72-3314(+)